MQLYRTHDAPCARPLSMDPTIEKRFENTARSKTLRNIIRAFALDKKAVLDIGCSFGEFTALFGAGSTGITIARDEAAYGRRRGLDIRYGNIEADDFSLLRTYDCLFANNLLEHLYSPHAFLCRIKRFLKPEGILVLGVPCIPKIVPLLHLRKFRGSLAVAHINFFTRDTLIKTVERAGWKALMTRGFHFSHAGIDWLLNPLYPHVYVVASIDPTFVYAEKRKKELRGYSSLQ